MSSVRAIRSLGCEQARHLFRVGAILVWLSAASLSFAQQAPQDMLAGYEGEMVTKIEIAAPPNTDMEAIQQLIVQKAGQPFSAAQMHASVQALQRTKLFTQVQLDIQPDQDGVRLVFILQPADYVGVLSFPGATNVFTYVRLLQAANIPEQAPFVEDLLPESRGRVTRFLHDSGYFLATVQTQVQRDEARRVVNIMYVCNLGRRAKIGSLVFDGLSDSEAASVRSALRSPWAVLKGVSLKPGKPYFEARIRKSVDFIRDHLRKSGRLAPSVEFASFFYDPETNRATITFRVQPGPLVSVKVVGVHVSQSKIRKLVPVYEESSVDRDLVDEGERNLTSYLQSKGFFNAKIDSRMSTAPSGSIDIVYEVSRGKRHRVEGVYFSGNHYFGEDVLQAQVSVKKGHSILGHVFSRGKFSDDLLRKSKQSIETLYKNQGFANVSVTVNAKDYDPDVDVTFNIVEGPQDKVQSFRLIDNQTQSAETLTSRRPLNLQPGKPYSPELLQQDRNRILAVYLNRGYLNAQFTSTATPTAEDPHLFDVVYTINEGPQAHVSDVVLLGQQVTRPGFIEKITNPSVRPGDPISEGKMLTGESDLYNLGVFDWASIKPLRPIADQTQEEVLIKVHESKRNTIDVGGGLEIIPRSGNIPVGAVALPGIPPVSLGSKFTVSQKSFVGPRFSFDFSRHNLRGRAETASIGTVLSRLDQRVLFTYSDPYWGGSAWSSLFSMSVERTTENPIYTADLGRVSFQVERALNSKKDTHLILRYSFQRTDLFNITIPDLVLPEDRKVRLSTFEAEYVRDTRDKPLDAHKGIYQTFDFGVTPKALGSSADFVRFLGQTAFYRPVGPWLTWANNFRLGLAAPFSGSRVPLSESFFSGGADSLRGFPINGAGPQRPVQVCGNPGNPATCTLISVPNGGNMLFIVNSELRFPIPLKSGLGGVVFYDGGNVYSRINFHQLVDDYTHTIGFGFRYQTPVGPIRFDIGRRITTVPGVQATQYFVTVGQAF